MGIEYIVGGLIASHLVAAAGGYYVAHHGMKAAVAAVANAPTTVSNDVANAVKGIQNDVAAVKAKVGA